MRTGGSHCESIRGGEGDGEGLVREGRSVGDFGCLNYEVGGLMKLMEF